VSDVDGEIPAAGEQVHVPQPSWLPVLTAAGLAIALVGVTLGIPFVVIGLLIAVPSIVRWIRSARAEMGELPPGH
jgi:hypothetical protein